MPSLELKYCNDKVWVENPRSCQNLKKTECQPETKFKTVKKPSQKCGRVAYDDCQNVPYEKCDLVTKQDCQNESFQVKFNFRTYTSLRQFLVQGSRWQTVKTLTYY